MVRFQLEHVQHYACEIKVMGVVLNRTQTAIAVHVLQLQSLTLPQRPQQYQSFVTSNVRSIRVTTAVRLTLSLDAVAVRVLKNRLNVFVLAQIHPVLVVAVQSILTNVIAIV